MPSVLYNKQNQCIWLARLIDTSVCNLGINFSVMQWPYVILNTEHPIGIGRHFHLGRHNCMQKLILFVQFVRFTMNKVQIE